MKPRGLKGKEAELLFEKWLASEGWTYHRAAATGFVRLPSGKSFCKSHDLFGCLDFIAFRHGVTAMDDIVWGAQVTTQAGRSERRKKLAAVAWPVRWKISVVSHERVPDPAHRGRTLNFWRIQTCTQGGWLDPEAVAFDRKRCEAFFRKRKRVAKLSS